MPEENKIESLADEMRGKIISGEFGISGRLPPVSQLARDKGMARSTVYQSLQLLQSEGLLIAKGNSYYANNPLRIPGITPSFDEYLIQQGLSPKMENLIEPELVTMPEDIAKIFGQHKGVHVIHRLRRQGTLDVPYRLAEIWYPANLAGQFLEQMRVNPSLNVINEIRHVSGLFIDHVHEDVLTRLPTHKEAQLLSILRTTPVLEVHRSNFAEDGTPIMFNKIVFVGPYFTLSYDYKPDHWRKKNA